MIRAVDRITLRKDSVPLGERCINVTVRLVSLTPPVAAVGCVDDVEDEDPSPSNSPSSSSSRLLPLPCSDSIFCTFFSNASRKAGSVQLLGVGVLFFSSVTRFLFTVDSGRFNSLSTVGFGVLIERGKYFLDKLFSLN